MPKLTINDTEIEVPNGTSILQACEAVGVEVPRFCYHDKLSVPANCRMCLVEMEKSPKPVASCAMACGEGMVIKTDSEFVHKARRGVMEMMLINHPLDCPICDQGGECDLQDQAVAYGFDRSRYEEPKRAVKDKDIGPVIKTIMTRCINCTRCIRFGEEVAGIYDLGQLHRGEDAEIGTFIEGAVNSELSGNLVDVCPVGALTSKPYAFKARPWELRKTYSIDTMDAVGSSIRVDAKGDEVMRILPRLNESVNEEWISDKTRLSYDGLLNNRLDRPYVRKNRALQMVEWLEAVESVATQLKKAKNIGAIAGAHADMDSMFALKQLVDAFDGQCDARGNVQVPSDNRSMWRMNTPIAELENADAVFLIGCNPRHEAAMVNARLTKAYNKNGLTAVSLGGVPSSTFPITEVKTMEEGFKALKKAERPVVIIGMEALSEKGADVMLQTASVLAQKSKIVRDGWNGFNVLPRNASFVGSGHLGFVTETQDKILKNADTLYLLHADDDIVNDIPKDTFVIVQGTHGGKLAKRANVILPASAYTEKTALYMNCEGRLQQTMQAVHAPGLAKEDWKIIRAVAESSGVHLTYDTHEQLRDVMSQILGDLFTDAIIPVAWKGHIADSKAKTYTVKTPEINFYETCPISRNSATMQKCTAQFIGTSPLKKKVA